MRPALAVKIRCRVGKIQQRCCQGRMASWLSQRHTVLSLMVATKPDRRACASDLGDTPARQGRCWRLEGNSQASALTWTTTSGGKSPGPSRALAFFQPRQTFLKESLPPQADDLSATIQTISDSHRSRDLRSREQNHLGSHDLKIR